MNIYIAASYSRIQEANNFARYLSGDGHNITSYWLTGIPAVEKWPRVECAKRDIADIIKADCVLVLTGTPTTTGGHHVETGFGLALYKRVVLVGPRQNVFHELSRVEQYDTFEEARHALLNKHTQDAGGGVYYGLVKTQDLMRALLEEQLRPTTDEDHGIESAT